MLGVGPGNGPGPHGASGGTRSSEAPPPCRPFYYSFWHTLLNWFTLVTLDSSNFGPRPIDKANVLPHGRWRVAAQPNMRGVALSFIGISIQLAALHAVSTAAATPLNVIYKTELLTEAGDRFTGGSIPEQAVDGGATQFRFGVTVTPSVSLDPTETIVVRVVVEHKSRAQAVFEYTDDVASEPDLI